MSETSRPEPAYLRHSRIRELVEGGRFRRTADLARELGVSVVTVRSDLEALEGEGVLRRVRGGAVGSDARAESAFEKAAEEEADAKALIAARCVALVRPGDVVMLDAGTTTTAVGRALRTAGIPDLTIVTNNLMVMYEMHAMQGITLIVTGGTFRLQQHSLVDPLGTTVIDRVRADIAFIGATGVEADAGVTNVNLPETEMKRAMIAASRRVVIAADHRKIGVVSPAVVCGRDEVERVVTDAAAGSDAVAALIAAGWDVDGTHLNESIDKV